MGVPATGVIGCGMVGLGIANVIPILVQRGRPGPGNPDRDGARRGSDHRVLGFLAGPPVIGIVADIAGLPIALGLVSLLCVLIATGGNAVRPATRSASGGAVAHQIAA